MILCIDLNFFLLEIEWYNRSQKGQDQVVQMVEPQLTILETKIK